MGRQFVTLVVLFFFSSRRRHTRLQGDWSSDVCSSDRMIRHTRLQGDWSSDVCSSDLLEHGLVSSHPDDTVPGAAPQCAVDIDPQAGPGPWMVFDRSRHGGAALDPGLCCKPRARAGGAVLATAPAMAW